eukprot:TRINITY_DN878_c0_g1_i2.p1 TRINITY_DN878_c0_g1~~TRINITY_DN878_c0_g1_i2.p1  ORF type:complete len:382 (-),score=80.40 TRINITY_DN878_c0_g1_i2:573-1718(-)
MRRRYSGLWERRALLCLKVDVWMSLDGGKHKWKYKKSASFTQSKPKRNDSAIPEEAVEVSAIKCDYYDRNDPDVLRLKEFEDNSERPLRRGEQVEDPDHFIKNANDEDEELYNGFVSIQQNTESNTQSRRTVKSARVPSGKLREKVKAVPLASPVQRPTTVPLAVVDEGLETCAGKKTVRRKGMKSARVIKGGGFAVIGKASKLTPRVNLKEAQFGSTTNINPHILVGSISSKRFPNLYDTANSTKSFLSEEEKRPIQQINVVTEVKSERPITAATKIRAQPFTPRPMSAYIASALNAPTSVPTIYMRPFVAHRRPISAAVNVQARQAKEASKAANPRETKKRYMRYLRELEREAQQFVIEEDVGQRKESGNVRVVKVKRN